MSESSDANEAANDRAMDAVDCMPFYNVQLRSDSSCGGVEVCRGDKRKDISQKKAKLEPFVCDHHLSTKVHYRYRFYPNM